MASELKVDTISEKTSGSGVTIDGVEIGQGYLFAQTVTFTSSGTFNKADYSWLRAIKVKVQGAGGGGGSGARTSGTYGVNHGSAAAAGGYGEKFITDLSTVGASETITVGAGGSGGASPGTSDAYNAGSDGGDSVAFGITAGGGDGGNSSGINSYNSVAPTGGTVSGTYDTAYSGEGGNVKRDSLSYTTMFTSGKEFKVGGKAYLSSHSPNRGTNGTPTAPSGYGYGGGPGARTSSSTGSTGQTGGDGVVILELYA